MNRLAIALNNALIKYGENIIVRRSGESDLVTKGYFRVLKGEEIRAGSHGVQLVGRFVLSPSGIEDRLPLRTGDKIVRNGQEKQIGWVDNKKIGDDWVRIEADVSG